MTTDQSTAAAERSAHVTRGREREREKGEYRDSCCVCGGPWKKGGASWAARVGLMPGVPILEVCSPDCATKPPFAR